MARDEFGEAQAAIGAGDGATARQIIEQLPENLATLEALAKAYYLEHEYARSIETWERVYALAQDESRRPEAIRAARTLAFLNGTIFGNAALMNGWLARANTLLGDDDSTEAGWVALSRGQFEGDRDQRNGYFTTALEIARRFDDKELEFDALAFLGANLVHADRFEEGFALLDEACAAVVGSDVSDFVILGDIFCQMFSACEYAYDVTRADEWMRIGDDIAKRRNLPAVAAYCRTHYGGVMTAAGRWDEAETALTEAVRLWALGHSMLRSGALIRLSDLRVRQGRYEEAERLLDGFETWAEAGRPLGVIHLARGENALARDVVERALGQLDPTSVAAGPLWALLGEIELANGDLARATRALEHVDEIASAHASDYLTALGALMRGRLCLASGSGDPRACLHDALARFSKIKMPMELASSRLELARAAMSDQPEVAIAEAQAAFDVFERLRAAHEADTAAALLRALGGPARTGPKSGGLLTKREDEVLELLGLGLSNPEISDRLFISRKTVEHHVGSVLAKLNLRSRAEAAAYAARRQSSATT